MIALVLDCADPEKLGAFWSEALQYRNLGFFDPYVVLEPDGEAGPRLMLQRVAEPKSGKNRMHFDIHPPDVDAEVARLEGLGAQRLEPDEHEQFGIRWIVMADPEGNEFCVCSA